ncbi:hypothetical protein JHK85_003447 [Glycine max]|nr:hypothetical protein JHK85_003447 [Glycine max]
MADQGLEGSQQVDLQKHPSGIVLTLQRRFAAVIMRIRDPKTTALIFASGKMVCTGAKSEQQSKLAARKIVVKKEQEHWSGREVRGTLWYPMKEQEDLGVINRANHVLEEMEFGSCS